MGQALYRKYRSRSLDEIVGQEHVTETLRNAIRAGRVSHAYLFTGPRGVGKTSIARILAHELNGVEYTGEDSHLDIIEIDAASNGGVEEIRDLRDKVYITPSSGKYKVYIIDEVHMMTTSAFNALLKTLEEPPAHTVFILATTEAHKLPATIISRTQRFTFKPIDRTKMIAHLKHIAKAESLSIDDAAMELIAERSEGSFRDAIQMLDQASSSSQAVTRDSVETLLGIPSAAVVENVITAVQQHDPAAVAAQLAHARSLGYQASSTAKQLSQQLRTQLIAGSPPLPAQTTLQLLTRLIDVPASHNADQLLEIVLLEAALQATAAATAEVKPTPPRAAVVIAPAQPTPATTQPTVTITPAIIIPAVSAPASPNETEPAAEGDSDHQLDGVAWQAVLDTLKKQYNTLYGIIRMASPEFEPGKVTLTFGFAFHQKRANDVKNKKILMSTVESVTGQRLAIECKFDRTATPPAPVVTAPVSSPAEINAALGTISNVFGGGEVLG